MKTFSERVVVVYRDQLEMDGKGIQYVRVGGETTSLEDFICQLQEELYDVVGNAAYNISFYIGGYGIASLEIDYSPDEVSDAEVDTINDFIFYSDIQFEEEITNGFDGSEERYEEILSRIERDFQGKLVLGSISEFHNRKEDYSGMWLSGESIVFFKDEIALDYWSEYLDYECGVHSAVVEYLRNMGLYIEWHDAGTAM